jgi:H+/Cl- antiporter ClcA
LSKSNNNNNGMSGLCAFKDVLGKPGEGVHAWRTPSVLGLPGLAAGDLLGTLGIALVAAWFLVHRSKDDWRWADFARKTAILFVLLWAVGIFLHWLFCVPTPLNKMLGI